MKRRFGSLESQEHHTLIAGQVRTPAFVLMANKLVSRRLFWLGIADPAVVTAIGEINHQADRQPYKQPDPIH